MQIHTLWQLTDLNINKNYYLVLFSRNCIYFMWLSSAHKDQQSNYFFLSHYSMKRRRLLPVRLLPTIAETLEDLPVYPSSSQSTQSSQSLEDYMTSIQALACPVEAPSCGPVRLQRPPRLRQFSKAQMKLSGSASLPRRSPCALRTSRLSCLEKNNTDDFSVCTGRERDWRGKDPVDWLFGQIRTWREMFLLWDAL